VLLASVNGSVKSKPKVVKRDPVKIDPVIEMTRPSQPESITLGPDSNLIERVAYELSMEIGAKFKKGDKFYTKKETMQAYDCGNATAEKALRLLREHGWLQYIDGNHRKGFEVK
jgi:hypothetical protein